MKKELLIIEIIILSQIVLGTGITSCGTTISIDGFYNLSTNISQSGSSDCITISTANVLVECHGKNITHLGNLAPGSNAFFFSGTGGDKPNITIQNCIIDGWGIGIETANNRNIENNTYSNNTFTRINSIGIEVRAGSSAGQTKNLRIINNTFINVTEGITFDSLIAPSTATVDNNTFINATIAIKFRDGTNQQTIKNNIFINGSGIRSVVGGTNPVVFENIMIANNTFTSNSIAIELNNSINGSINSNLITNATTIGISLDNVSRSSFLNNIISVNETGIGIILGASTQRPSSNNTFNFNQINSFGNAFAIRILESDNNTFNNTVISSQNVWIETNRTNLDRFINTTFDGINRIRFLFNFTLPSKVNVTIQKLNLSKNNVVFLNSSNLTFLNTSAEITLRGISFTNPGPTVDFADTGSFAACSPSICTELSFAGGVFTYNVTRFTSYSSEETSTGLACPTTINTSTTLTSNLTSSGTCISFGANNILLDCSGFTITGSTTGFVNTGINSTDRNNITVKNCIVRNFSNNILFKNTNNSIMNNITALNSSQDSILVQFNRNSIISNVFSNTSDGIGIFVVDGNNNTIENSTGISDNNLAISVLRETNTVLRGNVGLSYFNVGLDIESSNDSFMINNTGISDSDPGIFISTLRGIYRNNRGVSNSDHAIRIFSALNNTLDNNTGISNSGFGITIESNSNNNTIFRNNATSNSNSGIRLSISSINILNQNNAFSSSGIAAIYITTNSSNNNITMNVAKSNASADGIRDDSNKSNNYINNTAQSNTGNGFNSATTNNGLLAISNLIISTTNNALLLNNSENNSFISNMFKSTSLDGVRVVNSKKNIFFSNTLSGNTGLRLRNSNDNNISRAEITSSGINNLVLESNSQNNSFILVSITSNSTWMDVDGGSSGNNFSSTSFISSLSFGNVRINDIFTIPNSTLLTQKEINVSFNNVFVNSTKFSFLNQTGRIVLIGITFVNPAPTVNFLDGVPTTCSPSICTEVSFTGGIFTYDVTQFTTYSSEESSGGLGVGIYPILVRPIVNNTIPINTSFLYTFLFSNDASCSVPIFTDTSVITTDIGGIGFKELNITNITTKPDFLCEYRNGTFRRAHPTTDAIYERVLAQSLNLEGSAVISGNVSVNGTLQKNNINVCLENGTNCPVGINGTGNATSDDIVWTNNTNTVFIKPNFPQSVNISTNLTVDQMLFDARNITGVTLLRFGPSELIIRRSSGLEMARITAGANLGVGTTAINIPTFRLHIFGDANITTNTFLRDVNISRKAQIEGRLFVNDSIGINNTPNGDLLSISTRGDGNRGIDLLLSGGSGDGIRINKTNSNSGIGLRIFTNTASSPALRLDCTGGTSCQNIVHNVGGSPALQIDLGSSSTLGFDMDSSSVVANSQIFRLLGRTVSGAGDLIVNSESTLFIRNNTGATNFNVTAVGEMNLRGISDDGSGKVVCIKANRDLGTCSSVVGITGTCTCG